MRISDETPLIGVRMRDAWLSASLVATLVLVLVSCMPEHAYGATSSAGLTMSYTQSEAGAGSTTSESSQEKVGMFYRLQVNPSSRMTLNGSIILDVVLSESGGSESTQVQPKLKLDMRTEAVRMGIGYRNSFRDNVTQSTSGTREQHTESTDMYADLSLRFGKLPQIRARYNKRQTTSEDGFGVKSSDNETDDIRLSVNEDIFGITCNADYSVQDGKDKVNLSTDKTEVIGAQVAYAFDVGKLLKFNLRQSISISKSEDVSTLGTEKSEDSVSISSARTTIRPVTRGVVTVNYSYQIQEAEATDISGISSSASVSDSKISVNARYSLPKYLRFSGAYTTREKDNGDSVSESQVYSGKVSFAHRIKRIVFRGSYTRRLQESTTTNLVAGTQNTNEVTRDNLNLAVNYSYSKSFKMSLTDAYVTSERGSAVTESNRIRYLMTVGPWYDLSFSPSYELVTNVDAAGRETSSSNFTMQLGYMKNLHEKLDVSFIDSYQMSSSDSGDGSQESSSNTATIRLMTPNILKNITMSMDSTYSTNSSNGISTSTLSYNYRLGWQNYPHVLNLNLGYKTGSNTVDSYSVSTSYRLLLKMRRFSCSFGASYNFRQTMSNPTSSSHSIFLTLSIRK